MTITPEQLVEYIRAAAIFSPAKLDRAAGLPAGTVDKALRGDRGLPEKAAVKILHVFKVCGIAPVDYDLLKIRR